MLWLTTLLGLVDPITKITGQIVEARTAAHNALTEQQRIAADERAKALDARRAVLVAEAGSRLNPAIRAGFALPFVIYNAKLVLWDKVLALGSTDPLSPELFQVELACIGFYFLYDITARLKK